MVCIIVMLRMLIYERMFVIRLMKLFVGRSLRQFLG